MYSYKRLDYIDRMKGFAILLVVMGHLFILHTIEKHGYPAIQIISSFHMAFFFFLSGYMLAKTHKVDTNGVRTFILRKAQTLLLPWLIFSLIVPVMINHNQGFPSLSILKFYPVGKYWFLPLLFIFMMVWLVINRIENRSCGFLGKTMRGGTVNLNIICSAIFVLALALIGMAMHLYYIIIYAIYYVVFSMGYYISRDEKWDLYIMRKDVLGISALILIVGWKFGPIDTLEGVAWRSMFNLFHRLVCGVCGSVVFYNLFRIIPLPAIVDKYLRNTGKLSLVIYLIPIILLPLDFIFPNDMPFAAINTCVFAIGLVHNLISYCIGKVLLEIPYLRFMLFGKR